MGNDQNIDCKLRLLFVSKDRFPPLRVDSSILFGEEMVNRGHRIDWLLQSDDRCDASYETRWSGCRVWVGRTDIGTSRFRRVKKHIYGFIHDLKMFGLARRHNYDFIQAKNKFISALLVFIASKMNKSKFFYWLSYPFPEADIYQARNGIARYPLFYLFRGIITKFLLYRIILPTADHIFVQSEQMKRFLASKGIEEGKMTSVPMGVSLKEISYQPARTQTRLSVDEKIVLYLGTLSRVRKLDFLIEIFKCVLHQVPSAKLYLVGGGEKQSDEEILKDEAIRLGIDHAVMFTGFLPRQEAWRYVNKADVCVSLIHPTPILNVGSPTKLIEYMSIGKPVVANDHPEQLLVITESGAGICVPYNKVAFADAITELLNDPKKAKEMGYKGRRYVEEHRTYKTIAHVVENEYLRISKGICRAKAEIT